MIGSASESANTATASILPSVLCKTIHVYLACVTKTSNAQKRDHCVSLRAI